MRRRFVRRGPWLGLAGLALMVGCARDAHVPGAVPPAPRIVDAEAAVPVSWPSFVGDLLEARVVYVGESHDEARHHRAQAAIVRALHARDPSLAIGVEMVQRPFQGALDDWVAGAIDEPELLARVEWKDRWGFDFALYRPIFEYARKHRIPVVALNARAETTRAVAHGGLEALDQAARTGLPELDLEDAAHRAQVIEPLRSHDLDEDALERFYLAQVLWDETMARSVATFLGRAGAPRRMVVFAGGMHVLRPAIPARAARRGAAPYRIVLPVEGEEVDAMLEERPPLVDWIWAL